MTAPAAPLSWLLWAGLAALPGMMALSWALVRLDERSKKVQGRIQLVTSQYVQARALSRQGRLPLASFGAARLHAACAWVFGYDPGRTGQYPARPAVIVAAVLLLALALARGAQEMVGGVALLAGPPLWMFGTRRVFAWFEQRHAARLYLQFPDALAMIVRSVRVGIPVSEAVRTVSSEALQPTAAEFTLLGDHLAIGLPLHEALQRAAERNRLPEYRFFATALALQAQTGGGLSETLEGLAEVIRKRVAVRNRAYAMASEARLSTYILAGLPVVTGMVLSVINPEYVAILFTDPLGKGILAAAIAMLGTGIFVMRSIIGRSLR